MKNRKKKMGKYSVQLEWREGGRGEVTWIRGS